MNKKLIFFSLFLILIYSSCKTISYNTKALILETNFNIVSGVITNHLGEKLPGIVVRIDEKTNAVTDLNGHFSITGSNKDVITVQNIGYTSEKIALENRPNIIKTSNLTIELSYKNIVNVSKERTTDVPINNFSFPPIGDYTQEVLHHKLFKNCKNFQQLDQKISAALSICGYNEKSYFLIPDGFAIATRVELINADGTPIYTSERFSINESKSMRFMDWWSPRAGFFRLFIFIVTDKPFAPQSGIASVKNLSKLSRVGYNVLPINKSIDKNYNCTVVVYEFEADRPNVLIKNKIPQLSANEHLLQSKILTSF